MEFQKYSVGFQIYVFFLQRMIEKGKKNIYLGGGNYDYKKRFGSIEEIIYEGYLYRNAFGKMQSVVKNRLKQYVNVVWGK